MRIIIAYESTHGNGRTLVETLGDMMLEKGHRVDIFKVGDTNAGSIPDADLYVFSSPTHLSGPPRSVKKFLKGFRPAREGACYALMATFWRTGDQEPTNLTTIPKMDRLLAGKGMRKVEEQPFFVQGVKGPLEEGYREKLMDFAGRVLSSTG